MSNRTISWHKTIQIKIVFVVVISCILVLGGLSAFNTISEQSALSDDLTKLSQVTAKRLSKHMIGPMWDLDNKSVEAAIEAEMLEDRIQAIAVWDSETNRLFAARERNAKGALVSSNGGISGDLIKASATVNNGNQDIGEVSVYVSKAALKKQLREATINGVITLLLLIVVMVLILTMVMSRFIVTPIKRLVQYADDISHGNLQEDIRVESNDEIGLLADAFQRMQISLRIAFKRLQSKAGAS